jgi:hypothetical protein
MNAKRKIEIGKVYSAKVGGSWLPVRIDKSLGHGRYECVAMPSGKTVKVSTDAVKGDGQTVEAWTAAHAPKADDVPAQVAEAKTGKTKAAAKEKKERKPSGPDGPARNTHTGMGPANY